MLTNTFARNVGAIDRGIRAVLAVSVPVLYFAGYVNGIAAGILGVLAVLILRTSVTGKCGIYYGLRLSTLPKADTEAQHNRGREPHA